MNARRLTIVLPFLVITAVCGLVFARCADATRNDKAALSANGRADTSSGAQWRWQNPLPQGNNLRGASVVNANTSTLVGDYGTIVRTTDGENNWTIQSSGTTQPRPAPAPDTTELKTKAIVTNEQDNTEEGY